jgi:hypothetical protein
MQFRAKHFLNNRRHQVAGVNVISSFLLAIFTNFRRKSWCFFLENQCFDPLLSQKAAFCVKNANVFAKNVGVFLENQCFDP